MVTRLFPAPGNVEGLGEGVPEADDELELLGALELPEELELSAEDGLELLEDDDEPESLDEEEEEEEVPEVVVSLVGIELLGTDLAVSANFSIVLPVLGLGLKYCIQ